MNVLMPVSLHERIAIPDRLEFLTEPFEWEKMEMRWYGRGKKTRLFGIRIEAGPGPSPGPDIEKAVTVMAYPYDSRNRPGVGDVRSRLSMKCQPEQVENTARLLAWQAACLRWLDSQWEFNRIEEEDDGTTNLHICPGEDGRALSGSRPEPLLGQGPGTDRLAS